MKELSDIITFLGQRLEANLIKLEYIRRLKFDWNGHNAKPIPKEVIQKVKEVIIKLGNDKQPEIFPTGRETIQIEYECKKKELYYVIEKDFHIPKLKESRERYLEFEFYKDKIECLICYGEPNNNTYTYEGEISEKEMYIEINKLFNDCPDYYNGQDIKMVIDINKPLY